MIAYRDTIKKLVSMANGRKIVLYGFDEFSQYIYHEFDRQNCNVYCCVSGDASETSEFDGREIKNAYELLYEDKKDIFIVGAVFKDHANIYRKLTQMGFVLYQDFFLIGFGGYSQKFDYIDSLLGWNRSYPDMLGFEIYGKENIAKGSYKIAVLGGSTTDPTLGNPEKCWAELLCDKLNFAGHNVTLYNGGIGGYSANQEFYKLIRDVLPIKPDMVIAFDGFNNVGNWAIDTQFPSLSKYERKFYDYLEQKGSFAPDTLDMRNVAKIVHGAMYEEFSDSEEWITAVRKMHAVCTEFSIDFISFLQPMINIGSSVIMDEQKKLIESAVRSVPDYKKIIDRMPEFYKEVLPFVEKNNYTYDLTNIFDGKSDVIYDFCHYTQAGHDIISDKVFCIIDDKLKQQKGNQI